MSLIDFLFGNKFDNLQRQINRIGEKMATTQADIDALTVQAEKIQAELDAAQAANEAAAESLRAEIARLEDLINQGLDLDLTGIRNALQILDDEHPDAVVPEEF